MVLAISNALASKNVKIKFISKPKMLIPNHSPSHEALIYNTSSSSLF